MRVGIADENYISSLSGQRKKNSFVCHVSDLDFLIIQKGVKIIRGMLTLDQHTVLDICVRYLSSYLWVIQEQNVCFHQV